MSAAAHHVAGKPLIEIDRFYGLGSLAYLYTGAHAPALDRVTSALEWGHRCQSRGPAGRELLFEAEDRARAVVGVLLGRPSTDVAFVGDTSTAWNAIARGLHWQPGDNVVINEFEHPSVVYPWLLLGTRGLEVRLVRRTQDWRIDPADVANACDARTRAIIASQVGYVSGFHHDVSRLGAVAAEVRAPLFLDLSHALGVVPIDLSHTAIAVGASYKWLLGPYGVGIVAWNSDLLPDFEPGLIGWRSTTNIFADDRFNRIHLAKDARRFQLGAPSLAGVAGLSAAAEVLLSLGTTKIAEHARYLSGAAMKQLSEIGFTVLTPRDPAQRAGNVAVLHPEGEAIANALIHNRVLVWGGDGRFRLSFHVMNSMSDVDAALSALADLLPRFPASG